MGSIKLTFDVGRQEDGNCLCSTASTGVNLEEMSCSLVSPAQRKLHVGAIILRRIVLQKNNGSIILS